MIEKIIEIGKLFRESSQESKYQKINLDNIDDKENYIEEIVFSKQPDHLKVRGELIKINRTNADQLVKKYYWIGNTKANNPKIRVTSDKFENVEAALPALLKTLNNKNSKLYTQISQVTENFYEEINIGAKRIFKIDDKKIDENAKLERGKDIKLYTLKIGEDLICQNQEYLELINQTTKPKSTDYHHGVCSTCMKDTFVTSNTTKLQLKYYITDKPSFASDFNSFEKNFCICEDCYENAVTGENFLLKNFQTSIGESLLIIPQGMTEAKKSDTVFNNIFKLTKSSINGKAEDFYDFKQYINYLEKEGTDNYMINLLFFRKEKAAFKIKQNIQDISLFRIMEITKQLSNCNEFIPNLKATMSLSMFYYLLSGKSSEVGMNYITKIFKGEYINLQMLFDHFMQSERIRLYSQNKAKDESVYDFLKMIRFLFFLRNMELFKYENGVLPFMDLKSMDKGSMLEESILESMALSEQEESLMRVGFLLAQVSYAQYDNKLKNSPILEKVNFNGMDIRGVKRLITILEEKMRQYNLFYKNNVLNLQKLNIIIAKASGVWTLNNNENVFYIMAGYSIQRASRYKNDIGEGVTDQEEVQQTEIENEN